MAKRKNYSFKTMGIKDIPGFIVAKIKGEAGPEPENMTEQTGFYEINLVPDIKAQLIKMQKLRNFVFFCSIVVAIASASVAAVLFTVKSAQDITMSGQDGHLTKLSEKIMSYDELPEFLTIQNQLKGISSVEDNYKILSRAIILLKSLIPEGPDMVTVSELKINMETTTMTFDASANAQSEPDIDYRVLESFIKRVNLMNFDFGHYVDENGSEIPARCITEYDSRGRMLEENGSIYAIWNRGRKGCDPARSDETLKEEETPYSDVDGLVSTNLDDMEFNTETGNQYSGLIGQLNNQKKEDEEGQEGIESEDTEEDEDDGKVVLNIIPDEKIYRTPQFTKWYAGEKINTSVYVEEGKYESTDTVVYNVKSYEYKPAINISDGAISGVPHFESNCITYSGEEKSDGKIKWSSENNCKLVPEGVTVTNSSNGRDADDNLVLSFSTIIAFNPDIFMYRNKHIMPIGPNGQNVTDSYMQLEKIFSAPATACDESDVECNTNTNNSTGV